MTQTFQYPCRASFILSVLIVVDSSQACGFKTFTGLVTFGQCLRIPYSGHFYPFSNPILVVYLLYVDVTTVSPEGLRPYQSVMQCTILLILPLNLHLSSSFCLTSFPGGRRGMQVWILNCATWEFDPSLTTFLIIL